MSTPTVTQLPFRRELVSRDNALGELAVGEQRLYGDVRVALATLGAPLPSCDAAMDVLQERCS